MNKEQYLKYVFYEIGNIDSGRFLVSVKFRGFIYSAYSSDLDWYRRFESGCLTMDDMRYMSIFVRTHKQQSLRY